MVVEVQAGAPQAVVLLAAMQQLAPAEEVEAEALGLVAAQERKTMFGPTTQVMFTVQAAAPEARVPEAVQVPEAWAMVEVVQVLMA